MPSTERLWRDPRSGARMTERPRSQEAAASQAVRVVDWLEAGGAWVVLGAAMVLYALFVLWATRGTTMFVDEQTLFQTDAGLHPSVLFAPVNGHLILWERLLYAVDFKLFGASFVLPRIVEAISVVAVVAAFFALVKRRIGAAAALAPALLLLLFGTAWENDLSISGISTVDAVAAGLASLSPAGGSRTRGRERRSSAAILDARCRRLRAADRGGLLVDRGGRVRPGGARSDPAPAEALATGVGGAGAAGVLRSLALVGPARLRAGARRGPEHRCFQHPAGAELHRGRGISGDGRSRWAELRLPALVPRGLHHHLRLRAGARGGCGRRGAHQHPAGLAAASTVGIHLYLARVLGGARAGVRAGTRPRHGTVRVRRRGPGHADHRRGGAWGQAVPAQARRSLRHHGPGHRWKSGPPAGWRALLSKLRHNPAGSADGPRDRPRSCVSYLPPGTRAVARGDRGRPLPRGRLPHRLPGLLAGATGGRTGRSATRG